jgi:inner membrane transporter RhtA
MQSTTPYPQENFQILQTSRSALTALVAQSLDWSRVATGSIPPSSLILLSIVIFQIGAALAKYLFVFLNPVSATFLRLSFAALLLLVLYRPRLRDRSRSDYFLITLMGVTMACMNLSFYEAISRIPLGVTVSLEFVGPLGIAILSSRRPLDLLWVMLAGAGIILMAPIGGASLDSTGVGLALVAGGCWGAYIFLAGKTGRSFSGGTGLALAVAIGALFLAPVGIIQGGVTLLHPFVLVIGAGVGLISTVIPYSLEYKALKHLPPRVFGVLVSVEPAIAILIGFILLGEQLELQTVTGAGLVITAAIGITLWDRQS